ncbi:leucine rich repeat protein [Ichthyophthirius multifiliis]|uniref:Leucine rich repeat protein n=1 Tax=Ichthyophthirius multifiliis TaxID=5932 RepID=G0QIU3_ICHMU|nr:leucine rich repeat protein [Ichthyophthirius multifiliis]EGR34829.1 leucine rich repeat protein [Ichthyophthirius multifiliis]|eukprot:XP_004040133.1 leucine rich repeat protein [Ichthyophthirius multifiliis]
MYSSPYQNNFNQGSQIYQNNKIPYQSQYPVSQQVGSYAGSYGGGPAMGGSRINQGLYNQDYYHRVEPQVRSNLIAGAEISEIEMILEAERRKYKETREKIEDDLNNERKLRVEFENKLMRLKDESMKREMFVSELEYKVNTLGQENESIISENRSLKDELQRMQEVYNHKIRELEENVQYLQRGEVQMEEKFKMEVDRIRKDGESALDNLNRQWEFRYKSLEEKCKNLLQLKNEMENEINNLNKAIMKIKIASEEELRQRCVQIQEEEYRKFSANLRTVEQKLRLSEEQKDQLSRKIHQLVQELQEKDRLLNDKFMESNKEINDKNTEINDLKNFIAQMEIERDKLFKELQAKESHLSILQAEYLEFQNQSCLFKKNQDAQLEGMQAEFTRERRRLEDIRDQQARKIQELESVIRQIENEMDKCKQEYQNLTQMLQNNINRTISQTVTENHTYKVPNTNVGPKFDYKYK